jgi:hypothetical protein
MALRHVSSRATWNAAYSPSFGKNLTDDQRKYQTYYLIQHPSGRTKLAATGARLRQAITISPPMKNALARFGFSQGVPAPSGPPQSIRLGYPCPRMRKSTLGVGLKEIGERYDDIFGVASRYPELAIAQALVERLGPVGCFAVASRLDPDPALSVFLERLYG